MQIFVFAIAVLLAMALLLRRASTVSLRKGMCWSEAGPVQTESLYYREFIKRSPDAFLIVEVLSTGSFRFLELNPVAVKCIDPQARGFAGKNLDELLHDVNDREHRGILQELKSQLSKVVATGEPVKYEGKFGVMENGASRIYGIELSPVAADKGNLRIMCIALDTSERRNFKQERTEHAKSEGQFIEFGTNVPAFLFSYVQHPNGRASMPFASEGIHSLFGLKPEEIAQSLEPLKMLVHQDSMPQIAESFARSAADLSSLEVAFCAKHPVKGELWIECRAMPILKNDGNIVWHGFMHDITLRKHMDDAVRNSLKSYAESQRIGKIGSWELDAASGALSWSDEIYRILETDSSKHEASYDTLLNAVHPDDREAVSEAYAAVRDKNISRNFQYRFSFHEGRIKYIHERFETRYVEGKTHYARGTLQDISAFRISDQHLKNTLEKLRELVASREIRREHERKRLAWELHEELGQLLAAMKMRMYSLRSQLKGNDFNQIEDIRAVIELIDNSIRTVHDIVSELRPTVLFHGVVAALEWLVAEYNKHPGVECKLEADVEENIVVNDEMTTLVFRTAQEAMEYAMRQTNVTSVIISWMTNRDQFRLAVKHNGLGHSAELSAGRSQVIFGMQERVAAFGGEMQVFSTLDHDFVMEACFPNLA